MNSSSETTGATTVWPDGSRKVALGLRGAGVAGGVEHPAQQVQTLQSLADSGQISGSGVAGGALALTVEVLAAGGSVARGQIRRVHGTPASSELREFVHLGMQKSYDDAQIVFTESAEGWHAGVRPSGADHGTDLIAVGVLGDYFRAGQVRARFSTRGIFAMTESALRAEAHFALADLRGSIGLLCRRFRPGL